MSKKAKYNWNQPSLFPDNNLHPSDRELQGYKIVTNKNGVTQRLAIIRRTKEDFIRKSQAIWGDQYDYSETVYTGSKSPVTIRCKKHNHYFTVPFAQNHYMNPNGNVKPTGCDLCTIERTGIRPPRGPHHFRTEVEKQQEAAEKARRREERKQRAEQNKYERREEARLKRQQEQQAYIDHWKAKNLKEAHFLEKLQNRYPDMYDAHLVDFKDKDNKVTLICPTHGEFRINARQLFGDARHKPHGCWQCAGLNDPDNRPAPMTADEFFSRMHQLYDATELDFLTSEFNGKDKNVTAYCRKHGPITHTVSYWLEGKGCDYCNGKFYPPDFLRMAREKHGDKYQYRGVKNIKSAQSYIKIHCDNPDHHWHRQRVDLHIQGFGCVECSNYPNKKTPMQRCQEWIDKCIEKYGEGRYDYSRAHEDYVNNDSLVWIRCCIHDHWFQQTPDNNLRTVNGSCPICSLEFRESEGEAEIRRWLLKHGITNFKQDEVTLPVEDPRCKRQYLRPDFWLPDYNLFIEYNGEQHYEDIEYFHAGGWTLEDQQIRDEAVRRYCHDHHHNLLEILYTEFDNISEILTKTLLRPKAKV